MSGLSAAIDLCNSGFDVTIIEARDRVGGRIFTTTLPNSKFIVEVGAGWLHGIDRNTLADLCDKVGIAHTLGDNNINSFFLNSDSSTHVVDSTRWVQLFKQFKK